MDTPELKALTAWCKSRSLRWSPSPPAQGAEVMILEPQDARGPWQRMMLIMDDPDLRLEDEVGETLAIASDLPALLDAVDGGVGEPVSADLRGHGLHRLMA